MSGKKPGQKQREFEEHTTALGMLAMPDEGYDEEDQGQERYIPRDKRGRPRVMTRQCLQLLRTAFKIGCTDREACIFAVIGESTLYEYCHSHPDFAEEKEQLKDNQVIMARVTIAEAIGRKSLPDSWEYLKRKRKAEFSEGKGDIQPDAVTVEDLENIAAGRVEFVEPIDQPPSLPEDVAAQTRIKPTPKQSHHG
jgi:hypothetical protein